MKKKVCLADQPTQPLRSVLRRAPIWIRPKFASFELKLFEKSQLFTSRKLTPRLRLRLGLDLLGVVVLLTALSILIFRISTPADVSIYPQPDEGKTNCASDPKLTPCNPTSGLGTAVVTTRTAQPTAGGPTPTPVASVVAVVSGTSETPAGSRAVPTPAPTSKLTPTPTSTPIIVNTPVVRPDPTPGNANMAAMPVSVVLSYANNCMARQAVNVTLSNTGNILLLWIEDKTRTSAGLTITSPIQLYLLPPGQSTPAAITCLPANVVGNYSIAVLYDGGSLQIPINIVP